MAMSTSVHDGLKYEYMLGGGSPQLITMWSNYDTTGWTAGSPLDLDASGALTKHSGVGGNATTGIFAVALEAMPTTADQSTTTVAILVTDDTVFSGKVTHNTTASALNQSSQIGHTYQLCCSGTRGTTRNYCVEVETTTNVGAYIVAMKDATGTAYGRVFFVFNKTYRQESPWYSEATSG